MAKKKSQYFDNLIAMTNCSCQAAEYLQSVLNNFQPDTISEKREEMHRIEHAEDDIRHSIMERLAKEFVTPIDREDIIQLANILDDVTDMIEDILIRLYMYNVKVLRPEVLEFTDLITRSCRALQIAMTEFPNFQKSTALKQALIDTNTLEEEGDAIYISAVRKLFEDGTPSVEVLAWNKLFDIFENCCDICEHAADMIEIVIMKNS